MTKNLQQKVQAIQQLSQQYKKVNQLFCKPTTTHYQLNLKLLLQKARSLQLKPLKPPLLTLLTQALL